MQGVVRQSVTYPESAGPPSPRQLDDARWAEEARERASRVRVARIIALVAAARGVTPDDIRGECRKQCFARPRHEAMYLARCAGWSYPHIARVIGGRDHSTVIHGARKHASRNGLPAPMAWGEGA
jgi:chromosomal replication initiation ATPase DnaA